MFRQNTLPVVLSLTVLLSIATGFAAQRTLPGAIQTAEQLLAEAKTDTAACRTAAADLYRLCGEFPASALTPQGLFLAADLDQRLGRFDEALAARKRILENYAATETAPQAFESVFNGLTGSPAAAEEAAELAKRFAESRTAGASHYWLLALRQYTRAGNWTEAAAAGAIAQETAGRSGLPATDLLSWADAALLAGETAPAARALETYVANYRELPQIISVRQRLGGIYSAQANPAAAQEQFARAWSEFQKNRKKPEYNQPQIAAAASAALLAMQTAPRREFELMTMPERAVDKRVAARKAAELVDAYTLAMAADPAQAPTAFNAVGDVHARLGDALLKNGFRAAMAGGLPAGQTPYADALPEYTKAFAAYSLSCERSLTTETGGNLLAAGPQTDPAARYAAQRAFEVASGQADAVFAWALAVNARAPQTGLGPDSPDIRFKYFAETAAPLFIYGLELEAAALAFADKQALAKPAAEARQNLDLPLRPLATSLLELTTGQNRRALTASNQLAATFARGFQNSATADFTDAAEREFGRATAFASQTQDLLNSLLSGLDRCNPPPAAFAYWNDRLVAGFHDYATLCRAMQNDLAVCAANLKLRNDDSALMLRKRLAKLEARGSAEEHAGLLRWYKFTADREWDHPLNAALQTRLSEIDPETFGGRDDWPSANRKP